MRSPLPYFLKSAQPAAPPVPYGTQALIPPSRLQEPGPSSGHFHARSSASWPPPRAPAPDCALQNCPPALLRCTRRPYTRAERDQETFLIHGRERWGLLPSYGELPEPTSGLEADSVLDDLLVGPGLRGLSESARSWSAINPPICRCFSRRPSFTGTGRRRLHQVNTS
jgi:hypothetical protein